MLVLALLSGLVTATGEVAWRSLPIDGGGAITCLASSPQQPDRVLAGGEQAGLHLSLDGGHTWHLANHGVLDDGDRCVADVAFHPGEPRIAYAAVGTWPADPRELSGGLLFSHDGGETWQVRSRAIRFAGRGRPRQRGRVLATDPLQPDYLWAATAWQGVVVSPDRGATFTSIGPARRFLTALARGSDGALYVAVEPSEGQPGGLLVLRRGASGWATAYDGPVRDVAVGLGPVTRVLIATPDSGLILSEDAGRTWVNVTPAGFTDRLVAARVAFSPRQPAVGLATGEARPFHRAEAAVWLTVDGGRTWNPLAADPATNVTAEHWWGGTDRFAVMPQAVAFDPTSPQRFWLGDSATVWGTDDAAGSWFSGHSGLRTQVVRAIALDPVSPDTAYLGLEDFGAFRADLNPFVTGPLGGNGVTVRTVQGLVARRAVKGTAVFAAWGKGVWVQEQVGRWSAASGQAPAELGRLTELPDFTLLAEVEGHPPYVTRDRGESWGLWGRPPAPAGRALALGLPAALDPTGRELVAAHPDEGLFLTRDGGRHWTALDGPPDRPITHLAAYPGAVPVLYVATAHGLFRSLDRGASWARLRANPVRALAVDAAAGRVYVAVPRVAGEPPGLFASDDRGESWRRIDGDWPAHHTVTLLVPDGRLPGRLWVGTAGNGVLVGDVE